MRWRASLAACALAALAFSADAQPRANLAGVWGFETAPEDSEARCVISGRAQLTASREPNRYDVRMQVLQHCEAFFEDVRTEQICTATANGPRLSVDCRLVTEPDTPYLPDNFQLVIRNGALMEGSLVSGWTAPAVWRRDGDAYVS